MDDISKPALDNLDNLKLIPSESCLFCHKTIEEVGGKRIISQQLRGVILSNKDQGGGNKDYPHQSVRLMDNSDRYVVVWGEKNKWTKSLIDKAHTEFLSGHHPWFCQVCGERKCDNCGYPLNYPMGSDIIDNNGCSSHCAIHPFDPGCSNPNCVNYKEWGETTNSKT